ncbi:MAG: inorganic phosphate transporter family protein, partial [Methylococcaceae bacterium]|nr:inorganic phosphate transporter family protein [Methylococcaceae bacterium]
SVRELPMTITFLLIAVCFLAYANGANDNFKGVASLFGSGAVNYRRALLWANLTTLAGSLCSFYFAQGLLLKFSGKVLVQEALVHSVPFMSTVAGGAGATVLLATRLGFPVSTTHALLGAMIGSAVVAAFGEINLAALGSHFMLPLLLSPLAAMGLSMLVTWVASALRRRIPIYPNACLCEEGAAIPLATGNVAWFEEPKRRFLISGWDDCTHREARVLFGFNRQKIADGLHFFSSGAVCFARGLNDTPKIAALLLLVPDFGASYSIVLVAGMMILGGLFSAKRVAQTMSHKITTIDHDQGLSANLTTAFLVILASQIGMPVSTTHVSVGALFGIGLLSGHARLGVIKAIVLSWMLTLPCAALIAGAIYSTQLTL